jgi:tripartite-type tricarboxylate transporter receptor subunit TctC
VLAPGGTAEEIVRLLNAALIQAINSPSVRKRYANHDVEPMATKPEEMRILLRSEIEKCARVVRISGARIH